MLGKNGGALVGDGGPHVHTAVATWPTCLLQVKKTLRLRRVECLVSDACTWLLWLRMGTQVSARALCCPEKNQLSSGPELHCGHAEFSNMVGFLVDMPRGTDRRQGPWGWKGSQRTSLHPFTQGWPVVVFPGGGHPGAV